MKTLTRALYILILLSGTVYAQSGREGLRGVGAVKVSVQVVDGGSGIHADHLQASIESQTAGGRSTSRGSLPRCWRHGES